MRPTCLLPLVLVLLPGSSRAEPPLAPVLTMADQYQRPHQLGAARGDVVVIVYGDRHSAEANRQLGAALHVHFHPAAKGQPPAQASQAPVAPIPDWPAGVPLPDVRIVPVACAGKVPGLILSFIRSQLRSKSPDLAILIDVADLMLQYYGMKSGVTNVAVLDVQGRVRLRAHGPFQPADLISLAKFIEQVRLEAKGPSR